MVSNEIVFFAGYRDGLDAPVSCDTCHKRRLRKCFKSHFNSQIC